jgi:hypothetical protein
MMQGEAPGFIDGLHGRLPSVLRWCFMGAGAAAGWSYARTDATPIPLSYIIGGAAAGFFLLAGLFVGLRLVKAAAVAGVVLLVVNYALLIPFGYGDHLPGWLDTGKTALRWLDPSPLVNRWGKSVEIRPDGR